MARAYKRILFTLDKTLVAKLEELRNAGLISNKSEYTRKAIWKAIKEEFGL